MVRLTFVSMTLRRPAVHLSGRPAGVTLPERRHDSHELAWVTSGRATIAVGTRVCALRPGLGLWIPAGTPHVAHLDPDSIVTPAWFDGPVPLTDVVPVLVSPRLRALLVHLVQSRLSGVPPRLGAADQALELVHHLALPPGQTTVPDEPHAAAVARALLADPGDARTLAEWAREEFVGVRTLQRAFVEGTGSSFTDWRAGVRVRAALPLLAEGHPVAAVSREVGYRSTGGFITAFRRELGHTPTTHPATRPDL